MLSSAPSTPGQRLSSIAFRGSLLLLTWWILTAGNPSSWWIGVPSVLLALVFSVRLLPIVTLAWYPCLKFIPFFLSRSLIGAVDVALRAFHPRLPITPQMIAYPLQLPPGTAQILMINTVNLLPGTLSARLDKTLLHVHILDSHSNFLAELDAIQQRIARMLKIPLTYPTGEQHEAL